MARSGGPGESGVPVMAFPIGGCRLPDVNSCVGGATWMLGGVPVKVEGAMREAGHVWIGLNGRRGYMCGRGQGRGHEPVRQGGR